MSAQIVGILGLAFFAFPAWGLLLILATSKIESENWKRLGKYLYSTFMVEWGVYVFFVVCGGIIFAGQFGPSAVSLWNTVGVQATGILLVSCVITQVINLTADSPFSVSDFIVFSVIVVPIVMGIGLLLVAFVITVWNALFPQAITPVVVPKG